MNELETYPALDGGGGAKPGNTDSVVKHYRAGGVPHLGEDYVTPGTFEMTISGTTATFTNCTVQRQTYFIAAADKTCAVSLTGDCYIGYVLTEEDNSIAMATGSAFTDVADTAAPTGLATTFKVPLYKLTNGVVVCDYRRMTQPGAWA